MVLPFSSVATVGCRSASSIFNRGFRSCVVCKAPSNPRNKAKKAKAKKAKGGKPKRMDSPKKGLTVSAVLVLSW